jgi:hypothetical protein
VGRSILRVGTGATTIIALLCAAAALLASQEGCGSTDGSFSINDVGAQPSGYCRATHFPGFPDGAGSALLVGAVYLTPVIVIAGGTLIAACRGERDIFLVSFALAAVLVAVAMVVSVALAHVGYAGAG